jgi:hypothetical protein
MTEYFIVDLRAAWRKKPYISLHAQDGAYTWSIPRAKRSLLAAIEAEWGGFDRYWALSTEANDREVIFVPCGAVERLAFPVPVKGDIFDGKGPVLLQHKAVVQELRAAAWKRS